MIDLAVIGAGIMGSNHARIARQHPDARLAVVVDADLERADRLAHAVGAEAATSLSECVGKVDAAIVATPTDLHHRVAMQLIAAGCHVLVEKPLAVSAGQGREMVEAAEAAGVVLTVGHVERFNPAVLELDNLVSDPLHLTTQRISPFSPRVEVGVVLDLMIHDLDIVRHLAQSPVKSLQAMTRSVRSDSEDVAAALLEFDNGTTANLLVSRVGQQKIRELTVTLAESFVTVDLLRQDVTINRVDHSEYLSSEGARYRQTGVVEIPFLEHRGEPLALEQDDFIQAIRGRRPPRVSGWDGVGALELAEAVLDAARGA